MVVLSTALSLISVGISLTLGSEQFSSQNLQGVPPDMADDIATTFRIGLPVFALVFPFVQWIVVALLMQLFTGLFGGRGPLSAMLAAVGTAFAPFVMQGILTIPLAGLQAAFDPQSAATSVLTTVTLLISLAFFAWHVVLVVIGARSARQVSYGRSVGSCAISCASVLILLVLILVLIVVVASVVAG